MPPRLILLLVIIPKNLYKKCFFKWFSPQREKLYQKLLCKDRVRRHSRFPNSMCLVYHSIIYNVFFIPQSLTVPSDFIWGCLSHTAVLITYSWPCVNSGFTPGSAQVTKCDAGDQTWVCCLQGKGLTPKLYFQPLWSPGLANKSAVLI